MAWIRAGLWLVDLIIPAAVYAVVIIVLLELWPSHPRIQADQPVPKHDTQRRTP